MKQKVNLVDISGRKIGEMDKILAHKLGKLHEAFSILVFNENNELLLQKRANDKYHSGNLWSNTCCSHPAPGDERTIEEIANDRLFFEMGIRCNLTKIQSFYYREEVGGGLIEHEFDHVLVGYYKGIPNCNPSESDDYRWISLNDLRTEINVYPENFTPWFKIMLHNNIGMTGI